MLRLVADIVRLGLLVCAGAFWAAGDGSEALKALLVLAPALAGRVARVAPAFDLLFTLALAAEAIGSGLGALDAIGWGDADSHLAIPFLSAPIVYQALVRLSAIPAPGAAELAHPLRGAALVTAVGVLALGAVWELVEWGADSAFGTDYSQGYTDTLSDLLADAIAAAAGGVLVAVWLRATAGGPKTPLGDDGVAAAARPPGAEASVVIPTYERRESIERVVEAVLADEAAREVIVVVDGSDDGTYECLLEIAARDPRLRPLWQANAGQLAALQRGVDEASYPVVVMLDDDVVAEPGLITGHAARHAAGRRQVVLGYMPVREASTWPDRVTARLYSMGYEDQCRRWEADPRQVISLLWAGNMSLRRSDARDVGLSGPEGRLDYLEDRELGLRLMKAGFSAVFDRSLRASHVYSRSLEDLRRDAKRLGRNKWRLHDIHGDVLGPIPPKLFENGPWGPRLVIRLGGGPAGRPVAALLAGVAHALGRLGATRTSARHYGLLWGVIEQREYSDQIRRRRVPS